MSIREIFQANQNDLYCKNLSLSGNLNMAGDLELDDVTVAGTSNATNSASGALKVLGGVGIAKDLWVGGTIKGKYLYYYLSDDTLLESEALIPFSTNSAIDTLTGYNPSTHIFTAPNSGFYLLQCNLQIKTMHAGTYIVCLFSKNDNTTQDSMTNAVQMPISIYYYPMTFCTVAYLATNSTMKFEMLTDDVGGITFYRNSCLNIVYLG